MKSALIPVIIMLVGCPALADPIAGTHGPVTYGGRVYQKQDTANYSFSGGGEYTVYSAEGTGLLLSNAAYVDGQTGGLHAAGSFQTFCLEWDEYLDGNVMDIYVSHSAVDDAGVAGAFGSGSHAWSGGEETDLGDNLDPRTAWLYYQFAKGTLVGYDYTLGAGRTKSAKQLQLAIWFLEGELAEGALGTQAKNWCAAAAGQWNDIGPVRILQTVSPTVAGSPMGQDVLYVLVPVPAAVLLGALGLGVAGLKLRRTA